MTLSLYAQVLPDSQRRAVENLARISQHDTCWVQKLGTDCPALSSSAFQSLRPAKQRRDNKYQVDRATRRCRQRGAAGIQLKEVTLAFVPVMLMPTPMEALPVLLNVTACDALLVPTAVLPKVRLVGETLATGAGARCAHRIVIASVL